VTGSQFLSDCHFWSGGTFIILNPETQNPKAGTWLCAELPAIQYREALDLQRSLVAARRERVIDSEVVLLLEHPPVFTLGRRGGEENLMVSGAFLEKSEIQVIQVERGGDITFHGPGQLVVYPILDLKEVGLSVVDYVTGLEEIMIRTAGDWGITAERNPINRGIWVGNNKLGSVGIAIRRGVSFHGFAFNVNLSLEQFNWINPCGLQSVGMTSMERELLRGVPMNKVYEAVKNHIEAVFGIELLKVTLSELQTFLKSPA
jgi:lipoate-protein ligase B